MFYDMLSKHFSDKIIVLIASAVAFFITFILMAKPFGFLPRDGGKFVTDKDGNRIEVNKASSGKVTGVGLLLVIIWIVSAVLFLPLHWATQKDYVIYLVLAFIMMLTGYLDDCAKAPWGELVKGLLDFVLALAAALVFVKFNDTNVSFFKWNFNIPVWLYVILAVALIWGSINVTNCSDGVDGLCGTVTVIELFAFSVIFGKDSYMTSYTALGTVMAFVLVGYLAYNWNPSTVLMGDAGSRTIGFFLALLAMKSGHPFAFLLLSLVFIIDGGLGLVKLTLLRTIHADPFKNIRLPLHDHMRKNKNWSIPKIVIFFALCQIVMSVITGVIIHVFSR